MLNFDYTLNDSIYRHALKRACQSEVYVPGKRFIITGGAAVQLLLGNNGEKFRPTDDIDIFPESYFNQKLRRQWSKILLDRLKEDGFSIKRNLTENWSEVIFGGLQSDLFIRLNCFGSYYYLALREKIGNEFKRGILQDYEGVQVRYQHPIDIIVNKVKRIVDINNVLGIPSEELRFVRELICKGVESINLCKYMEDLEGLVAHRELNVEDLGRMEPDEVSLHVQGYKVRKDIYDICCVIEASKNKGIEINHEEFRKSLGLMLSYSSANER